MFSKQRNNSQYVRQAFTALIDLQTMAQVFYLRHKEFHLTSNNNNFLSRISGSREIDG
jgi:hypothetical protein